MCRLAANFVFFAVPWDSSSLQHPFVGSSLLSSLCGPLALAFPQAARCWTMLAAAGCARCLRGHTQHNTTASSCSLDSSTCILYHLLVSEMLRQVCCLAPALPNLISMLLVALTMQS